MIDYYEPRIDLTLLGCGFLGGYHVGAICLLSQIWPQKPFNKICGASSGGLLAALMVSGLSLEKSLEAGMGVIRQMKKNLLNKPIQLFDMRKTVEITMDSLLPENAHILCQDRLGLSLTKLWPFKNKFVFSFESKKELIDAVVAGCYIPIWSGGSLLSFPKYKNDYFMDGAYSNNLPSFEPTSEDKKFGYLRLNLSPFSTKDADVVSPKDKWSIGSLRIMGTRYHLNWKNVMRAIYAMSFTCNNYAPFVISGHQAMKERLLNSNLIKCWQCYYQGLTNEDTSVAHDNDNYNYRKGEESKLIQVKRSSCIACLRLLEKVDSLEVPQEFINISIIK